jgi:hypothetical protein
LRPSAWDSPGIDLNVWNAECIPGAACIWRVMRLTRNGGRAVAAAAMPRKNLPFNQQAKDGLSVAYSIGDSKEEREKEEDTYGSAFLHNRITRAPPATRAILRTYKLPRYGPADRCPPRPPPTLPPDPPLPLLYGQPHRELILIPHQRRAQNHRLVHGDLQPAIITVVRSAEAQRSKTL